MIIKSFYYIQPIRAVANDETGNSLRNMPMYDNKLVVYKNATSQLNLEIKRLDRKALVLTQDKLYHFNILSHDGEIYLVRKSFRISDVEKGRLTITIDPEDLDNLMVDRYNYSISYVQDGFESLLYLTTDGNAVGEIEVKENALPITRPPFTQHTFTRIRTINDPEVAFDGGKSYISSRLPVKTDRESNTLKLEFDNYVGKFVIQYSKDYDPNHDLDWIDSQTIVVAENSYEFSLSIPDARYYRVKFTEELENTGAILKLTYN
jgi:hypothetical protein